MSHFVLEVVRNLHGLSRNTDFLRWIRQIRHILKLCNICVCAQLLHILDLDVHFVLELVCETSWHMRDVDSFTNAQIQHGLTQGRESSNCSRQIAVCHMVTSWHDDDRHLRLYVEMQSEDSHVRASRVRVVAIGRGHNREGVGVRDGRLGGGGACDDDVEEEGGTTDDD